MPESFSSVSFPDVIIREIPVNIPLWYRGGCIVRGEEDARYSEEWPTNSILGNRARRRLAREQSGKMTDHLEGLSSDDEETSTDTTNFNMERGKVIHLI